MHVKNLAQLSERQEAFHMSLVISYYFGMTFVLREMRPSPPGPESSWGTSRTKQPKTQWERGRQFGSEEAWVRRTGPQLAWFISIGNWESLLPGTALKRPGSGLDSTGHHRLWLCHWKEGLYEERSICSRPLSLVVGGHLPSVVSWHSFSVYAYLCVQISPFDKDTSLTGWGPTLMTSF